jgi:hypothetical protein
MGYLAVGLTFVYALSGLAVNHIAEWDPNFVHTQATHHLGPLPGDDDAIAKAVLSKLAISEAPTDVYRAAPDRLEILFDKRTLHVDPESGEVLEEREEPRFLLRVFNWLHLNRGKKAWRYFADAYAGGLLLLATSGLFMLPGKKGIVGRGAIFVAIGIAIPLLYVHFSGGP